MKADMKFTLAILTVALATSVFADSLEESIKKGAKYRDDPKAIAARAANKEKFLHIMGGFIEKPGSMKGKIAIVEAQTSYKDTGVGAFASQLNKQYDYNFVYEKAVTNCPVAIKAASKADIAIVVVANDKAPVLLAAPEDGWAVVNMKKLVKGLDLSNKMGEKMLASRTRKEIVRAFAIVAGGFGSQYSGSAVNATDVTKLDESGDFLPFDVLKVVQNYLEAHGITKRVKATYRQAYIAGWAPAPTNEYQKAAKELVDKEGADEKKGADAKK